MKTCTRCNNTKPFDAFYKSKRNLSGLENWCKVCRLENNRKWVKDNRDQHRKLTTRWYQENKQQHCENSKEWYSENKARKLATTTAREKRCRDATPPWVNKSELQLIYLKAQQLTESTGIQHEVDHIVPLTHDLICGLNVPANLQVLTREENRRKSNRIDHLIV